MTILITLENPERTGAPKMASQYARAMVGAGHRVLAACGPPPEATGSILPELASAGVEIRELPSFDPRNVATVVRRLRALIRESSVTCIVGFQQRDRAVACFVAGLTGIRCVISAQNQHVFRGGPLERWTKEWIYRWNVRGRADLVICTSRVVQEEIRDRFGVEEDRTTILPNGIDVQAFPTVEGDEALRARREIGVSEDERLLLNVGRIDRQKGQDLLLHAFRELTKRDHRARLALVGAVGRSAAAEETRVYEERLHTLVRKSGLAERVDFLGWRDDVPRLLAAADLYVQPSRWEGWPVAVVEAMAAGLPIVTSDCSGRPRGFVDGEHGWVVPTGDVEALRQALSRALARSDGELRIMGARGRNLAERHYEVRRLGERFVKLVEEAVAT